MSDSIKANGDVNVAASAEAGLAAEEAPPPESTLPYPPLHMDKKFVVLSDWDGTITTHDSNDYMTDNLGFGKERRRQLNLDVLEGRTTFRESFKEDLDSVAARHSFEECKEILKKNIHLDASFEDFFKWCKANDVPVVLVSSGMAPLIRAVLSTHIGDDDAAHIDIISNDVHIEPSGKWEIQYRHPTSGYGHDKSHAILPYRKMPHPPLLFFFGDGVSDLSAARHADILFVKVKSNGENDLATFCEREGIPHVRFSDFSQALKVVQKVVRGELSKDEALKLESL